MLIQADFLSNDGAFTRVINTETVIYMDPRGVLFAPDVHARWRAEEYERVLILLARWDTLRDTADVKLQGERDAIIR